MKKLKISLFVFILSLLFVFPRSLFAYDPLSQSNNIFGIGVVNHSDIEDVSKLVNSSGGDWGYVKVIITEENRNKEIWQNFLDECRRKHLIPIVRVASKFDGTNWTIPDVNGIDSWVNFFNSLNWVVENRYVVIANEPNHAKEWGGTINPKEYATYLKTFSERLRNSNNDYFVLNAGFDQAAPNSKITMDEKKYIEQMLIAEPDIFNYVNGWNSHSYPNPAFSGSKLGSGRKSIKGYEWELDLLKVHGVTKHLPIFITETGWVRNSKNEKLISENMRYAFENVWMKDKNIVAVTPFILNYTEEPFYEFSWKNKDGSYFSTYNEIQSAQKLSGAPVQRISGNILFSFLNPLMIKNSEQRGFSVVVNTGQATWTEGETHVINDSNNEIKVSNTKFSQIEPYSTGLVVYTLSSSTKDEVSTVKLGFYVRGKRVGDIFNGKIITF